jgi:hypothetical protein
MEFLDAWRQRAKQVASRLQDTGRAASERVSTSVADGLSATASVASEAYTAALNWKNNSEFSNWLTDHLSNQYATVASKAMDAEYKLLENLNMIDLHHGLYSSKDPYTVLEVCGARLTIDVREVLRQLGFETFLESTDGFTAQRSTEEAAKARD